MEHHSIRNDLLNSFWVLHTVWLTLEEGQTVSVQDRIGPFDSYSSAKTWLLSP